ncbi:hypothetical protein IQ07DRAFT_260839 [Pyrenochaeta sp. DS3sAY3a]|nr:hypothetical protein IQ07DRAFT_260839 [Pyrenochaeta sp. DS3sAY3a]
MPNSIIPHISPPLHPHVLLAIILLLSLASPASPLVLQNTTIALPKGSSDHNTPGLLCTPTRPIDLLIFYLLNYVAHAATVLTRPGERADDYLTSVFGSLLFPALGLYRGIEAILCGAVWVRNDDLRKAARSGALCVVVRDAEWRPRAGDEIGDVILRRAGESGGESAKKTEDDSVEMETEKGEREREGGDEEKDKTIHILPFSPPYLFARFGWPVFVHRRIIHGTHSLPNGYSFAILPHDTAFLVPSPSSPQDVPSAQTYASTLSLTSTHNMVKATIALAQSAYALTTLYRARGDQIAQFGFAAFGLTVAPYAVMSIVNLLGNLYGRCVETVRGTHAAR